MSYGVRKVLRRWLDGVRWCQMVAEGVRCCQDDGRCGKEGVMEVSDGGRKVQMLSDGVRKVSVGVRKVSNCVRKVSDGDRKVSEDVRNLQYGVRKVSDGVKKVSSLHVCLLVAYCADKRGQTDRE